MKALFIITLMILVTNLKAQDSMLTTACEKIESANTESEQNEVIKEYIESFDLPYECEY